MTRQSARAVWPSRKKRGVHESRMYTSALQQPLEHGQACTTRDAVFVNLSHSEPINPSVSTSRSIPDGTALKINRPAGKFVTKEGRISLLLVDRKSKHLQGIVVPNRPSLGTYLLIEHFPPDSRSFYFPFAAAQFINPPHCLSTS